MATARDMKINGHFIYPISRLTLISAALSVSLFAVELSEMYISFALHSHIVLMLIFLSTVIF